MAQYIITGIFLTIADTEDLRDARRQAERRLRKAGFQGYVVEVEVNEREGERCPDATKTPETGYSQNL